MTTRCEISAKAYQIRFYDVHDDKYSSCFQVYVDGNKGFIHSLIGERFYEHVKEHIDSICRVLEIDSIQGHVVAGHFRLIQRALGPDLLVEKISEDHVYGRPMCWIKISRIER